MIARHLSLAALCILALPLTVSAQITVTWDGGPSGNGTAWGTANNWTTNTRPGSNTSTNSDTAQFDGTTSTTAIGLNFANSGGTALGTPFYVGTVSALGTNASDRTIGSSTGTAGILVLNGTGANNLILSNAGSGRLTLAPRDDGSTTGSGLMSIQLSKTNSTIDVSNTAAAGGISISAVVGQTTAGNGITKTGGGLLILSGANTYTGATNVNAGTVLVNGNQSAATGAVTVANTGSLGGTGTVGGATTVQSGGRVFGGDGTSTGTLTAAGVTVQSGGTLGVQLGAGTAASSLNTSAGVLNLTSGAIIDPNGTFSGAGNRVLATVAGGAGGLVVGGTAYDVAGNIATYTHQTGNTGLQSFGALQLDVTDLGLVQGDQVVLARTGSNQLVLNFSPVPEPASLLAVCGLAVAGLMTVRKLRRKGQSAAVTPVA